MVTFARVQLARPPMFDLTGIQSSPPQPKGSQQKARQLSHSTAGQTKSFKGKEKETTLDVAVDTEEFGVFGSRSLRAFCSRTPQIPACGSIATGRRMRYAPVRWHSSPTNSHLLSGRPRSTQAQGARCSSLAIRGVRERSFGQTQEVQSKSNV